MFIQFEYGLKIENYSFENLKIVLELYTQVMLQ